MSEQYRAAIDILTAQYVTPGVEPFDKSIHAEITCDAIRVLQSYYEWLQGFAAPYTNEEWLRVLDSDTEELCGNIKCWARLVREQTGLREEGARTMNEQPKWIVEVLTAKHVTSSDEPFDESIYAQMACDAIQMLQDHYRWLRVWAAPYTDEEWLCILDEDTEKLCGNIKLWARWVREQAGFGEAGDKHGQE